VTFATVINCMDGRTQLAVNTYLQKRCRAKYIDTVTEPGPVKILAEQTDGALLQSINDRLRISVGQHQSRHIAIVGHHDCAGNPVDEPVQRDQLAKAAAYVKRHFGETEVIRLWVDAKWKVHEIRDAE
jgi:hypothetical protein